MNEPRVDFLARVASDRRRRVAEMALVTPAHVLRERLARTEPAGRLEHALRRGGSAGPLRLLCEIKRASPSRGMLNEHVDPVATAKLYEAGERPPFQSSPRWTTSSAIRNGSTPCGRT